MKEELIISHTNEVSLSIWFLHLMFFLRTDGGDSEWFQSREGEKVASGDDVISPRPLNSPSSNKAPSTPLVLDWRRVVHMPTDHTSRHHHTPLIPEGKYKKY